MIEPEDPTRTIPNPQRRALAKQIRAARTELSQIERQYGAAAAENTEQHRPTMRGFKIAYGKLGKQLRAARERLSKLIDKRRNVPSRVEIRESIEGDRSRKANSFPLNNLLAS
jgi:septal ring factor EnvC (AmiA/AmiB activator)